LVVLVTDRAALVVGVERALGGRRVLRERDPRHAHDEQKAGHRDGSDACGRRFRYHLSHTSIHARSARCL
jgi:hypothetical protein